MLADPLRAEQALTNLLDNALRHGDGPVSLWASRNGSTVELHVSDEGPGVPTDYLGHAFERFTRAEESRTGAGAGLGLAIVEVIARAQGGSAHLRNRREGGADAWLVLPAAD
jgi:signal transduction histidine kinase